MEHPLKLWGRATSYNVQKVAWVIAELELPHERLDAGGSFGGLSDPDYIAMNPNKRVPTLIDGDFVVWESNSICRYLIDAYGASSTFQLESAKERARADMWMEWFQNNVYSNFIALFYQVVRLPPSQRNAEKRARLEAAVFDALAIFDAALSDRRFIAGDLLSLGDIPTGAFLYRYFTMDIDRPPLENIDRYYASLSKRQAYLDAVAVDYSALRGTD